MSQHVHWRPTEIFNFPVVTWSIILFQITYSEKLIQSHPTRGSKRGGELSKNFRRENDNRVQGRERISHAER